MRVERNCANIGNMPELRLAGRRKLDLVDLEQLVSHFTDAALTIVRKDMRPILGLKPAHIARITWQTMTFESTVWCLPLGNLDPL